jgi:TRAP-type mannitol/chloroaromatic compound transport system permease large subunit
MPEGWEMLFISGGLKKAQEFCRQAAIVSGTVKVGGVILCINHLRRQHQDVKCEVLIVTTTRISVLICAYFMGTRIFLEIFVNTEDTDTLNMHLCALELL